eukprot:COSAG04_NODE_31861_length_254_cov_0.993548_1_plen_73_part_01
MVERLTPEEVRFFKTEGYLIKPAAREPPCPPSPVPRCTPHPTPPGRRCRTRRWRPSPGGSPGDPAAHPAAHPA